jgi:hypothetical protein
VLITDLWSCQQQLTDCHRDPCRVVRNIQQDTLMESQKSDEVMLMFETKQIHCMFDKSIASFGF